MQEMIFWQSDITRIDKVSLVVSVEFTNLQVFFRKCDFRVAPLVNEGGGP